MEVDTPSYYVAMDVKKKIGTMAKLTNDNIPVANIANKITSPSSEPAPKKQGAIWSYFTPSKKWFERNLSHWAKF